MLKRNYRTTRELAAAAASFLAAGGGEDAESLTPDCTSSGPRPLLAAFEDDKDLTVRVAAYLKSTCLRQRLKVQTAAVLVPKNAAGPALAQALTRLGVSAQFMQGTTLDLDADVVKVLTYHSAKGLEFPTVVLTGLEADVLPRVLRRANAEEQEEEERHSRRLVFVGITRAMQNPTRDLPPCPAVAIHRRTGPKLVGPAGRTDPGPFICGSCDGLAAEQVFLAFLECGGSCRPTSSYVTKCDVRLRR
jgi:superfamily I DNA/RNA helicase